MLLHGLLAALLFLFQTPVATPEERETNVFLDLGSEHCAQEIAIAAFENTEAAELAAADVPAYVTYSAFAFESAEGANSALDDAHVLVAQTFSDDPNITEREDFDEIVAETGIDDYGDRSIGYTMHLPQDDENLDVLSVNMLGIVKESQLVLILKFGEGGDGDAVSPGLSADAIRPFAEVLNERWDGTGEIADAVPDEGDLPPAWQGRDVTLGNPPTC